MSNLYLKRTADRKRRVILDKNGNKRIISYAPRALKIGTYTVEQVNENIGNIYKDYSKMSNSDLLSHKRTMRQFGNIQAKHLGLGQWQTSPGGQYVAKEFARAQKELLFRVRKGKWKYVPPPKNSRQENAVSEAKTKYESPAVIAENADCGSKALSYLKKFRARKKSKNA
jgi:hypothetical protein